MAVLDFEDSADLNDAKAIDMISLRVELISIVAVEG